LAKRKGKTKYQIRFLVSRREKNLQPPPFPEGEGERQDSLKRQKLEGVWRAVGRRHPAPWSSSWEIRMQERGYSRKKKEILPGSKGEEKKRRKKAPIDFLLPEES